MHEVAQKHQLRIARQTLRMSLAGAAIMGGMSYAEAYRLIFRISLAERIRDLMVRYPEKPTWLSWELEPYGYTWDDFPALLAHAEAVSE